MKRSDTGGTRLIPTTVVLYVNWNSDDREWNLNANRTDENRWNAGNRVFSRRLPDVLPGAFAPGSFLKYDF